MSGRRWPQPARWAKRARRRTAAPAPATCRCGHAADAHEHYRAGSDCSFCGTGQLDGCTRYQAAARR